MSTLFETPPGRQHKAGQTRLAANLIGGTTVGTADHLDFLVKNYVPPALGATNLDLHLGQHQFGLIMIKKKRNTGIMENFSLLPIFRMDGVLDLSKSTSRHTRYRSWPPVELHTRILNIFWIFSRPWCRSSCRSWHLREDRGYSVNIC